MFPMQISKRYLINLRSWLDQSEGDPGSIAVLTQLECAVLS